MKLTRKADLAELTPESLASRTYKQINIVPWFAKLEQFLKISQKKRVNAIPHNRAQPYFRIQHGRGEVRARRVHLNVHSVTGNVVDTE